jgi:uncharacterized protein (DUF983 family)
MFPHAPYSPKFTKMNPTCPECGQDLEIEPGFYYGAMYMSYALSLTVMIPTIVATYIFMSDPAVWVYLTIISVLLLLLTPLCYRYARVLMIFWFGFVKPVTGSKSERLKAKRAEVRG